MTDAADRPPVADALVVFGLTGDLGEKKLLPALLQLHAADRLAGPVIAVARSERSDDDMRAMLVEAAGADEALRRAADTIDIRYLRGDTTENATFEAIADSLRDARTPVVYGAVPPHLFAGIACGMAAAGLAPRSRLVIEKPFGTNGVDATELHDAIIAVIEPDRLFIVDHFLSKAAVENMLVFRTANPLIDRAMCAAAVDRVEVVMDEQFGVDGRGSFYDGVGAVRDVVQNHLLQLVTVLAMDAPADDSARAFDEARADLLRAVAPLDPAEVVLGQFEGYLDADGVAAASTTETFVAARLRIDNDRWRGVPFVVRAGKRLSETRTEAVVVLKGSETDEHRNRIRFPIVPDTAVRLELNVIDPADHGLRPTELEACVSENHDTLGDYATMLDGALRGDHRHFARIGDVIEAWRIVDPVLDGGHGPRTYAPGSAGPPFDHIG